MKEYKNLTTYNPKEIEQQWYTYWEEKGYFHEEVDTNKEPFSIVLPPPNVTGQLHMGHALDNTLQDILIVRNVCKATTCCGCLVQTMQGLQRK